MPSGFPRNLQGFILRVKKLKDETTILIDVIGIQQVKKKAKRFILNFS
jgi:hypothetical protein